ncbi:DUF2125 domain-containing protein [Rhodobacteraceae bacterium RKSG542]|uniref:DUF2125 domain-containing protein n=1 Tax=Pseudovibrio flavus TaxID=2529854 RepID=UPI0012BB6A28|nr:DUF2125 domain-containing protein [Pseudovibrio flavus]MTI18422.1 DUF2125 domain-containing protein [Pseudovibrio flavus]
MSEDIKPKSSPRKPTFVLIGLVVLFCIGWTGFWFYGKNSLDARLAEVFDASDKQAALECTDRSFSGFPARYQLNCSRFSVENAGEKLTLDGLRAVTMAYTPNRLIVEADGPASAVLPSQDTSVDAEWASARASARFGVDQKVNPVLSRLDLEIRELELDVETRQAPLSASAQELQLHTRRNEEQPQAMDVAGSLSGFKLLEQANRLPDADVSFVLTLNDGMGLVNGKHRSLEDLFAAEGIDISLKSLRVQLGDLVLETQGELSVDQQGRLSGDLPVTIEGIEGLAHVMAPFFPEGSKAPKSIQTTMKTFGSGAQADGKAVIRLPITLKNGRARLVFIDLGPVPPLF